MTERKTRCEFYKGSTYLINNIDVVFRQMDIRGDRLGNCESLRHSGNRGGRRNLRTLGRNSICTLLSVGQVSSSLFLTDFLTD